MYIRNNEINITYYVHCNKYKKRNYQCKWISVKFDYTFFIQSKKSKVAFEAQVGPLCEDNILAVWG